MGSIPIYNIPIGTFEIAEANNICKVFKKEQKAQKKMIYNRENYNKNYSITLIKRGRGKNHIYGGGVPLSRASRIKLYLSIKEKRNNYV